MAQWMQALAHLLAPRVCHVCGRMLAPAEEAMCLHCSIDLPRTNAHRQDFNIIHRRLGHACRVDRAAGWFYYKRQTQYARLLVDAKYNGQPALIAGLGKQCAQELGADGFFDGIDCLVPAPMHWTKKLRRGYNQAEMACLGISSHTGLPIAKGLKAARSHGVLSRTESRDERFSAISGTIALSRGCDLARKRVLIVDDIITTGATMAECVKAAQQACPASVSVLALGLTTLE